MWRNIEKKRKRCSECGSKLHIHAKYTRAVRNINGEKRYYEITRYKCSKCGVTVSWPPGCVNKYDRYSKAVKRKLVKERIGHRQSLYELRDKFCTKIEQRRPVTTTSYWTQQAGRIAAWKIKEIKVVFSGELIIDETHVRVARIWRKVITAIDAVTRVIVAIDLLPKDEIAMNKKAYAFFEEIKERVGMPTIVTTDMYRLYWDGIRAVFKDAKHQYCVFHTIKLIYKKLEGWYGKKRKWPVQVKHLFEDIKQMFHSKDITEAKKRLQQLIERKIMYTKEKAIRVIFFLKDISSRIFCYLEENSIAKTSNLIERLFKFFKQNYKHIYHFRTENACINYINVWALWKNSRKYQRGHHKDKSPYELASVKIKSWINLLI